MLPRAKVLACTRPFSRSHSHIGLRGHHRVGTHTTRSPPSIPVKRDVPTGGGGAPWDHLTVGKRQEKGRRGGRFRFSAAQLGRYRSRIARFACFASEPRTDVDSVQDGQPGRGRSRRPKLPPPSPRDAQRQTKHGIAAMTNGGRVSVLVVSRPVSPCLRGTMALGHGRAPRCRRGAGCL